MVISWVRGFGSGLFSCLLKVLCVLHELIGSFWENEVQVLCFGFDCCGGQFSFLTEFEHLKALQFGCDVMDDCVPCICSSVGAMGFSRQTSLEELFVQQIGGGVIWMTFGQQIFQSFEEVLV